MKAVWVTRSFLDYRIPVHRQLNERLGGELTLFYNADYVPKRCSDKAQQVLGARAKGIRGERAFAWSSQSGFANKGIRLPYQPGLIRAILDEKPDVLISDGFFQWTYAALWLRATRGIPHVMCYERTAHTEWNAQWYRTAYRKLVMRWIDAMCCNGRLCGEYARGLGFPKERITYGHMVADVEGMRQAVSCVSEARTSAVKAELGLQRVVFLYVGQLISRKGIDKLLMAWKVFSGTVKSDGVTLLLVGDGPQRSELEQYCASHVLNNVRFVGAVDYDTLAPFYRVANLFVIPTLEDNWSLVVPEAMACGLPILCSKYNGCWPEYVTPSNGWVFDPLSAEDTCDCLRRCFSARERLPEMGRQSEKIVGHHTPKEAAEAVLRACEIALVRGTTGVGTDLQPLES